MGVVVPFPQKYDPFRGGHAPARLSEPFVAAVYEAIKKEEWPPDTVTVEGEGERPFRWLLGRLWNCTDRLPSDAAEYLGDLGVERMEMDDRRTYASAARQVAARL